MSVEKAARKTGTVYRVRWRDGASPLSIADFLDALESVQDQQ